jgi:hypothetical protein
MLSVTKYSQLLHLTRRAIYDKRISQEVNGEDLGEEFAGYVSLFHLLSYIEINRSSYLLNCISLVNITGVPHFWR